MTAHYEDGPVTVWHGDCIDVMRTLPDASVDAVVTDPPYGLEFMGKEWDGADGFRRSLNAADVGRESTFGRMSAKAPEYRAGKLFQDWCELWATEALRVLKPGGHLLAFGGTRTFHRLTAGIEDAGFEIRDSIAWLYGSGFPKSLDVSKAIDKAAGAEREAVGYDAAKARPNKVKFAKLPEGHASEGSLAGVQDNGATLTAPSTEAARAWQGWGTALKPAFEPVVVARKPLSGTVAQTVLQYGTGALNIDASRIAGDGVKRWETPRGGIWATDSDAKSELVDSGKGRWPANVILDASQAAALDAQSGALHTQKPTVPATMKSSHWGGGQPSTRQIQRDDGDATGASRFFYTAKASTDERPVHWKNSCDCEDAWPTTSHGRATAARTTADASSTTRSGSSTTGPSPTATRFTTSTTTSSTTGSRTSSPSPRPTTNGSTPDASSVTVSGGSPAASVTSSNPSDPLTGTSAAKAGPSTAAAVPATSHEWFRTSVCGSCGAPAKSEAHATVKPVDLMRWLVRLVTPPGGTVLEPFAGSGTTVEAAVLEGFRCVAIEREADYLPLILQRIRKPHAVGLDFGDWDWETGA